MSDAHSWLPVDLLALGNTEPEPPTILGLIYPGRRHVWSGEPESGKSMAALAACVDVIRGGDCAAYIDFEMGAREGLSRLRALGLTDDELAAGMLYLEPSEAIGSSAELRADLDETIATHKPRLVIGDSYSAALALHGLDPNVGTDIERFNRALVEPLRVHGAAVVLLDHLTKNRDTRGRYAIGSERKIAVADVHLGFEAVRPLGRGRNGLLKITTHKDRPGYLRRPRAGEIEFASNAQTGRLTWEIRPAGHAEADNEPATFRPTGLMEKVSRHLEGQNAPVSRSKIEEAITGKRDYVRLAIDTLAREGYIGEAEGSRGAREYAALRPFRDHDLAPTSPRPEMADLAPTSPQRIPFSQADSATSPHLAPTSPETSPHDLAPDSDLPYGGSDPAGRGQKGTK